MHVLYYKMRLLPKLVQFAAVTMKKYNFDESHGLGHALIVLHNSHEILESLLPSQQYLESQRNIIYTSALVHDLCDDKYMNIEDGLKNIHHVLKTQNLLKTSEISVVEEIISTMSYSKVKKQGYPDLGIYQLAYHIVRESDLLAAYDFDRCLLYNLNNINSDFNHTFQSSLNLFENRVFKHNEDNLFITDYSKEKSLKLEKEAQSQILRWRQIIDNY
jgi:hypothetical protein